MIRHHVATDCAAGFQVIGGWCLAAAYEVCRDREQIPSMAVQVRRVWEVLLFKQKAMQSERGVSMMMSLVSGVIHWRTIMQCHDFDPVLHPGPVSPVPSACMS